MSHKVPKEWIPQQVKAFSRWVAEQLRGQSDAKVQNVITDLQSGVALVELAQILTGKQAPRKWPYRPTKNVEKVENCDLAIQMFKDDNVKFVSISGKDVNDGKEVPILGLIWTLILHYSVDKNVGNKDSVIDWAIKRTSNYANIHDFTPYDLSMCALLDSYVPDKINYKSLKPNDPHNFELAQDVMDELEIPIYIDKDDLDEQEHIDEKVLITQLTSAKTVLEKLSTQETVTYTQRSIEQFSPKEVDSILEQNKEKQLAAQRGANQISTQSATQQTSTQISTQSTTQQTSTRISTQSATQQASTHEVTERKAPIGGSDSDSDLSDGHPTHPPPPPFVPREVPGDNSQYADRKFGLIMTLNESDYNEGKKMNENDEVLLFGDDIDLAVTLEKDGKPFLNPAGAKLNLTHPDIANDVYQQFTFGKGEWNTVIDSFKRKGMVWDVADQYNTNPPAGTPFYLFPFHGRHNQHFVYQDEYIYAKQNGMVVTYVGGDVPFQMMPKNPAHKARQQFKIQLL